MLDSPIGKNKPDRGSDQGYTGPLRALLSRVQAVIREVRDIENHLPDSYPAEALSSLSRRFEDFGKEFTNYHVIKRNDFYEIVHRSAARLEATKDLAREAQTTARLFERYAKRPKTYSASDSRSRINRVQAELENLRVSCSS